MLWSLDHRNEASCKYIDLDANLALDQANFSIVHLNIRNIMANLNELESIIQIFN